MAKSKSHRYKPRPARPQQKKIQQITPEQNQEAPAGNRQERRAAARGKTQQAEPVISGNRQARRTPRPQRNTSGKPMWIRILILIFVAVMLIGFIVLPILNR